MKEIIHYAKERGVDISIRYINDEDAVKIQVSKKDGISVYTVDSILYNCVWSEEILLNRIKTIVSKYEGIVF